MPIIFKYDEGNELLSTKGYEAKDEDALGWVMQEFCKDYSFNFDECKFFWWPEDEDVVELDEMLFPYQTKTAGGTVMKTDQIQTVYAFGPKIPALEPKREPHMRHKEFKTRHAKIPALEPQRGPQRGPELEVLDYIGVKELWVDEEAMRYKRPKVLTPLFRGHGETSQSYHWHAPLRGHGDETQAC
jgi:hypothetical protein